MKALLESTKEWVDIDTSSVYENQYDTKDGRRIFDPEILRIVDDVRIGNPKFYPLPYFVKHPFGLLFEPFKTECSGELGCTPYRYWFDLETLEYSIESGRNRFSGIARADVSHPYPCIDIDNPGATDWMTARAFRNLKLLMTSAAGALVAYNARVGNDDRYRNPDGTLLESVKIGEKVLKRPKKIIFKWMKEE